MLPSKVSAFFNLPLHYISKFKTTKTKTNKKYYQPEEDKNHPNLHCYMLYLPLQYPEMRLANLKFKPWAHVSLLVSNMREKCHVMTVDI